MKVSIVIPAHNEEKYITKCIESVNDSSKIANVDVEIIIVLNRCKDNTEKIAKSLGAKTIKDDIKNLSHIRNTGIKLAKGEIIMTLDADSLVSKNLISEVLRLVKTDKYVGGGVRIKPERKSLGLFFTDLFLRLNLFVMGVSAGSFWFKKKDFEKINGFNEKILIAEDLDFAKRLKKYGKTKNKKFNNSKKSFIITSCRKFDKYGDWHWFKFLIFNSKSLINSVNGKDRNFVDKYFYNFNKK